MALFSNTLAVIRQYLGGAVDDLILSTVGTAGGTAIWSTAYVDTMLRKGDDYYNEHHFTGYCYSGSAIGQEREVSDFVNSGSTISFNPAFSPAIGSGDKFELHHIFSEDEYRRAINLAIESLADGKYLIEKIDSTAIVLIADTYEYTLPTDMYYIYNIITEDSAGNSLWEEAGVIDPRDWRLISPRKLKLHEDRYSVTAGKYLRLEGQGRQDCATADTATIKLPLDWLVQKAITFLPIDKVQSNQLDKTYNRALVSSAITPKNYPNPRSQKVVE